jgi:hypothetical protein
MCLFVWSLSIRPVCSLHSVTLFAAYILRRRNAPDTTSLVIAAGGVEVPAVVPVVFSHTDLAQLDPTLELRTDRSADDAAGGTLLAIRARFAAFILASYLAS